MVPQLPVSYLLVGAAVAAYIAAQIVKSLLIRYRLKDIPTVVPSSIFSYYYGAFKLIWNSREILQKGYDKHYGSAFRIPDINRWNVIVTGDEMLSDIGRATDDQLSFTEAVNQGMQMRYTFGKNFISNMYHVNVVRGPLTRNIAIQFPEVRDEIVASFADEIPPTADWKSVRVMDSIRRVVSRTTNRLFVGLPLCRDPTFRNLNIDFTIDLAITSQIFVLMPAFIRPFVVPFLRTVPRQIKKGTQLLGPIIKDRMDKDEKYGNHWEGRPNDLISWLLDEAPVQYKTVEDLTLRVLFLNFSAIHTTSMTFANSLYYLAAYTEYIKPLREEVEAVVNEEGWNKTAMSKMRKLDSFLKEVQRMTGVGGVSTIRTALKDFAFSNGLTIPAGTFLSTPAYSIHHDEVNYADPHVFKGFRFAEMHESHESEALKHRMVTTTADYLLFGYGRHACPGRFFAVNEIKIMIAHVLLTYDVMLANDSHTPPPPIWIGISILPDERAEVLFRARSS